MLAWCVRPQQLLGLTRLMTSPCPSPTELIGLAFRTPHALLGPQTLDGSFKAMAVSLPTGGE